MGSIFIWESDLSLTWYVVAPIPLDRQRFEHSMGASKIETKIKFPAQLDMTQYTTAARRLKKSKIAKLNGGSSENGSPSTPSSSSSSSSSSNGSSVEVVPTCVYNLFAVINHQGKMDTGHYTAYARHRGEVMGRLEHWT